MEVLPDFLQAEIKNLNIINQMTTEHCQRVLITFSQLRIMQSSLQIFNNLLQIICFIESLGTGSGNPKMLQRLFSI